ncbi:hypothetical protein PPERSA_01326 [Pseudocohnilembus persalinus]|uniref:Uncharacterized protein n=1 Tax=Pseudocohnilembus persalinus TaxID=266149 RepID=A0A0V0QGV6_PSEPJ|nr:hypothetical protein PPERSA_01326 [Pseudocohnilembus persalinus]|eukprot:KRX01423.1 hypothetical protein PPERSA_01326 [Pseudocohnilembus persalinus]
MENYQVNADKAYDSVQQKYDQKRNFNPPKANLESKQDNIFQKRLVKALPDKNKDYFSQIDNLPGQIKSLSKLHKKYDFESQIMNLPGYQYSKDKQALENDKSQTQLYKEKYYKRFQQSMGQEIHISYVIGEYENQKKKQFQVNQGHKQNYQIKNSQRKQKNEAKGHIEQLREISKKIPNLRKY